MGETAGTCHANEEAPLYSHDDSIHDQNFTAPPYTAAFVEHLDSIEVEYLEFFTQLAPVGIPPVAISRCLTPEHIRGNSTKLTKRISFKDFKRAVRKFSGLLKHEVDKIFGLPPPKPKFGGFCAATSLRIDVYYHVVTSSFANFQLATRDQITEQTEFLNSVFRHLDITFVERDLNYRIIRSFASSKIDLRHPHRRFSRSGTYADLNVWIVEDIGGRTIGYTEMPDATLNAYDRSFDGVVIHAKTLPGSATGSVADRGTNLVHEVGHWLGLNHIFDKTTSEVAVGECTKDPDADHVVDTQQFSAHRPEVFDDRQVPCGETRKVDVTNYMGYSQQKGADGFGFSTGQKSRIYARYLGARRGIKDQTSCFTSPIGSKRDLPPNVVELLSEDGLDCTDFDAPTPDPDPSNQPPPDPDYPQYAVLPIERERRKPVPPFDPKERLPVGSSALFELCSRYVTLPGAIVIPPADGVDKPLVLARNETFHREMKSKR
ncbi:hypothetical protein H2201_009119 [Coniosporium apollinis]|uniref:Peptidase M43 pregnancy-associated plasma-A domain-containing protein n=1 Tax=Coniosporium apollinis TaxID=61459 RepID=A0ABQ9NEN7_9PEZI|nr:hypothetical protein H2201_009119 [Coniosporium apollinis]